MIAPAPPAERSATRRPEGASRWKRLRRDVRGAYLIEMAFVLPIFLMIATGVFDLAFQAYLRGTLIGAVQAAGRLATIEGADTSAIDARVTSEVGTVARFANFRFQRENFDRFADIRRAEDFTDSNSNGVRDAGECFVDVNGNRTWDLNRAAAGNGNGEDVVLYTVTATYNGLFPLWRFLARNQQQEIKVQTVLRNQPYANQSTTEVTVCT